MCNSSPISFIFTIYAVRVKNSKQVKTSIEKIRQFVQNTVYKIKKNTIYIKHLLYVYWQSNGNVPDSLLLS